MSGKKERMLLFIISVSVIMALAYAEIPSNAIGITNEEAWISQDGQYDYPVDVLDEEWKKFTSAEEMRRAIQIPEEVLESISTEELLLLILKYPLLCDIHAFDTLEDGYEHLKEQFNGIQEFLSRQDAFEELIAAYDAYPIRKEKFLDYNTITDEENYVEQLNFMLEDDYYRALILQDGRVLETVDILEMLLKDVLENGVQEEGVEAFAEVYAEKLTEKSASDYYKNVNPVELLDILQEDNSELLNVFDIESKTESDQTVATIYIYTPSGKSVEAKYFVKYTYADISKWLSLIESYNATLISSAPATFNCHSYAWLHNIYPDRYQHIWLDYATAFAADSAYTRLTRNTAVNGTIVYYQGNLHSAVATGVRGYNQYGNMELYVLSKWGGGPMVKHLENSCPYYQGKENEYFYLEED